MFFLHPALALIEGLTTVPSTMMTQTDTQTDTDSKRVKQALCTHPCISRDDQTHCNIKVVKLKSICHCSINILNNHVVRLIFFSFSTAKFVAQYFKTMTQDIHQTAVTMHATDLNHNQGLMYIRTMYTAKKTSYFSF